MFVIALLQTISLISGQSWQAVCDGRPVLGRDENEVECGTYCQLLRQGTAADNVKAASIDGPTYRQLYTEPDRFRGKLVAIQGLLKRVTVYDAPDSVRGRTGITTLYEAWLALSPSGEPLCIVLSTWPNDMPHSGQLNAPVVAHGYFFKRYRYASADGWREAPLLIGGSISRQPATQSRCVSGLPAALPCAAVVMALAILRFWLWVDDRCHRGLSPAVKVRG